MSCSVFELGSRQANGIGRGASSAKRQSGVRYRNTPVAVAIRAPVSSTSVPDAKKVDRPPPVHGRFSNQPYTFDLA
jgi:hypothetical protein